MRTGPCCIQGVLCRIFRLSSNDLAEAAVIRSVVSNNRSDFEEGCEGFRALLPLFSSFEGFAATMGHRVYGGARIAITGAKQHADAVADRRCWVMSLDKLGHFRALNPDDISLMSSPQFRTGRCRMEHPGAVRTCRRRSRKPSCCSVSVWKWRYGLFPPGRLNKECAVQVQPPPLADRHYAKLAQVVGRQSP